MNLYILLLVLFALIGFLGFAVAIHLVVKLRNTRVPFWARAIAYWLPLTITHMSLQTLFYLLGVDAGERYASWNLITVSLRIINTILMLPLALPLYVFGPMIERHTTIFPNGFYMSYLYFNGAVVAIFVAYFISRRQQKQEKFQGKFCGPLV